MSKFIYRVDSANCDEDNSSPGVYAYVTKAQASKAAKACADELFAELEGHSPGRYKVVRTMGSSGVVYTIAGAEDDYACNWFYVEKMTLRTK